MQKLMREKYNFAYLTWHLILFFVIFCCFFFIDIEWNHFTFQNPVLSGPTCLENYFLHNCSITFISIHKKSYCISTTKILR
jgi:hypothetical protein